MVVRLKAIEYIEGFFSSSSPYTICQTFPIIYASDVIVTFRTRRVIVTFRTCRSNRVPSLLHHSHPVRIHPTKRSLWQYPEVAPSWALTEVKLTWKRSCVRIHRDAPHRIFQMTFHLNPHSPSQVAGSHVRFAQLTKVSPSYICPQARDRKEQDFCRQPNRGHFIGLLLKAKRFGAVTTAGMSMSRMYRDVDYRPGSYP